MVSLSLLSFTMPRCHSQIFVLWNFHFSWHRDMEIEDRTLDASIILTLIAVLGGQNLRMSNTTDMIVQERLEACLRFWCIVPFRQWDEMHICCHACYFRWQLFSEASWSDCLWVCAATVVDHHREVSFFSPLGGWGVVCVHTRNFMTQWLYCSPVVYLVGYKPTGRFR